MSQTQNLTIQIGSNNISKELIDCTINLEYSLETCTLTLTNIEGKILGRVGTHPNRIFKGNMESNLLEYALVALKN